MYEIKLQICKIWFDYLLSHDKDCVAHFFANILKINPYIGLNILEQLPTERYYIYIYISKIYLVH